MKFLSRRFCNLVIEAFNQLIASINILRSGLFDDEIYRKLNPACSFGKMHCIWHWVRHGVPEDRHVSHLAFESWALSALARREISVKTIHSLARNQGSPHFEKICDSNNIDLAELQFFKAYEQGDFSRTQEILNTTEGLFYLRKIHSAMRRMPALGNYAICLRKIEADPSLDFTKLGSLDQKKYYDIALAAGMKWSELVKLATQLANPYNGNARFAAEQSITPDIFDFAALAQTNARRSENFLALTAGLSGENDTSYKISLSSNAAVIVFIPEHSFLRIADTVQTFIIKCIKRIVSVLISQGQEVVCLPLPFVRDVTQINLPFSRVISYHTYASNRPDILHFKEGSLRDFLMIDPQGYSGASKISAGTNRQPVSLERLAEVRQQYKAASITKYDQTGDGSTVPKAGYIFVPMQVADDSVRRWQYLSTTEIVKTLTDANPDLQRDIIVKPHPFDNSYMTHVLLSRLEAEGKITVIRDQIQALIKHAAIVITANSGVGLEALLLKKPVISTGESEYSPAVQISKSPQSLIEAIRQLEENPGNFDWKRADTFLANLFEKHLLQPGSGAWNRNFEKIFDRTFRS